MQSMSVAYLAARFIAWCGINEVTQNQEPDSSQRFIS
ncbi:hypothetical protein OKW42_004687 [Paraburkholderia sp. WC7.3d]